MLRNIQRFKADEDGGVLVFIAVCLVVIVGMAAITFDLGRLAATQGDLQAYADHVALAAAGELDGSSDAITRATNAASAMIRDRQTFADGGQELGASTDYAIRFLSGLPASDTDSVDAFVTTNPEVAELIEVTATPRTVFLPFARAMTGLLGAALPNEQVGAVAVAGFTQYACDITPLMFCLPDPSYIADANIGDAILLRSGGQGAAWGPGDFGFLDPSKVKVNPKGPCAGLKGVNLDACLIAAAGSVTQCFSQRGVDIEPGQKVGIENAIFNTRFDIFTGIMNSKRNDPKYGPGPHVISGLNPGGGGNGNGKGNGGPQCLGNNAVASTDTMPFPPDDCFPSCGRIGDGNWSAGRAAYVAMNHDGTDPAPLVSTRYEMYKAEIAAAGGPSSNAPILNGKSETGRRQCSPTTVPDIDRRVFIAAGIDCAANPINGAATNVPVKEFFKVFLMRPVGDSTSSPPVFDLWVEVVGSAGGNGAGTSSLGGMFRDVVELVR
jgi:Flp pilus assembly protein TadG